VVQTPELVHIRPPSASLKIHINPHCVPADERGKIDGRTLLPGIILANTIIGGTLIGIAAAWLWLSLGRIAGVSGIAAQALMKTRANAWPVLFVIGLGAGGWIGNAFRDAATIPHLGTLDVLMLITAGLLVGFGTRLGSGCTSGHGVCGSARLSKRSISATAMFIVVGMLTATLMHAS